jgi:hypothetical protein
LRTFNGVGALHQVRGNHCPGRLVEIGRLRGRRDRYLAEIAGSHGKKKASPVRTCATPQTRRVAVALCKTEGCQLVCGRPSEHVYTKNGSLITGSGIPAGDRKLSSTGISMH